MFEIFLAPLERKILKTYKQKQYRIEVFYQLRILWIEKTLKKNCSNKRLKFWM